ncbi:MAG TPA: hypothetical protein ENL03_00635, partial [Phycisphaerae bacterium]|nr:hypothetical protein [Phycisphaerae bacterium]
IETDNLTIPHPRMTQREFVLRPLAQIAPQVIHPILCLSVAQMLENLRSAKPSARLVSIIGPPAAGKTTLAEGLAGELDADVLYEDYQGNPFIADSYLGLSAADLPCQLYFLLSRAKQLATAAWPTDGIVVADYGFCQDAIYAGTFLAGSDMQAYNHSASRIATLLKRPDLLISLDCPEQVLLDRIARRGRGYEKAMTREFISQMRQAYRNLDLAAEARCVMKIDCEAMDFRQALAIQDVAGRVKRMLEEEK